MDALPDGVLESILMRLDSPVSLVRAASACKAWHRVIADSTFLRRFRSLHGPTIAGVYNKPPGGYRPCSIHEPDALSCFSPSPASGVAGSGRSFSLGFLSRFCIGLGLRSGNWKMKILESYGSLLLLCLLDTCLRVHPCYLVVCEPASRRCCRLPACIGNHLDFEGAHLLNGDGGDVVGMLNFRVLFCVKDREPGRANYFMFSSTTNKSSRVETPMGPGLARSGCIGHTRDAIYWHTTHSTVVALDRSTAQWSSSSLPLTQGRTQEINMFSRGLVAATAGRDGDARIVIIGLGITGDDIEVFANRHGEWVLDKRINIGGSPSCVEKYSGSPALVLVSLWDPQPEELFGSFIMDLETTEIKEEPTNSEDDWYVYPCPCDLPWPPAFQ